jgi:sulfate adenylyltransferase
MVAPHANKLINRIPDAQERTNWLEYALFLRKIKVDRLAASDLELIGTGAYSPLTGFLNQTDYRTVVRDLHLSNGIPWTIPVTLAVTREEAMSLHEGQDVALRDSTGLNLAILRTEQIYPAEKRAEAEFVFGTTDLTHPGVLALHQKGDFLLGGSIVYLAGRSSTTPYHDYYLTPFETRKSFQELGWERIVAFETKNPNSPLHRTILEISKDADGILIHPTASSSSDDLPPEVKLRCYEILLQTYFPPHRTFLSAFPAEWRNAREREAVHHAIVRKNYGATDVVFDPELYGSRRSIEKLFNLIGKEKIGVNPVFVESMNEISNPAVA